MSRFLLLRLAGRAYYWFDDSVFCMCRVVVLWRVMCWAAAQVDE